MVGRNLTAYREAKGLGQEGFAAVWRVHRSCMGKLERGRCKLSLKKVEEIARQIDVAVIALLSQEIVF